MPPRASAAVVQEAVEALAEAVGELGVTCTRLRDERVRHDDDAIVEIGGQRFAVEAKTVVTAAAGAMLPHRIRPYGLPLIIVADRIADGARQVLRSAPKMNFYDRRGVLHIVSPPIVIDAVVGSGRAAVVRPRGALDSQVAKEVAIACLSTPDRKHRVREVARYLLRAPSAVSVAMSGLRDRGLLTSAGEPLVPDLFHELVTAWRPSPPVLLAGCPTPVAGGAATRLGLGIDGVSGQTGWALTSTLAAVAWGMPLIAEGDHPPDFYVPDAAALRVARARYGVAADPASRSCTLAVAPVRLACLHRVDRSAASGEAWPVVGHIIVACDIAQDRARGLESLQQWQPDGITRAW